MQKIYLEKAIDLNHQLKELIAISVDELINYKIENEGIRAVGNLIIKGEYRNVKKESFEQVLELDVLATFDKIVDQTTFNIKVFDFDYHIKDGNILVIIEVDVFGVVDGEDRFLTDELAERLELQAENIVIEKIVKISFRNKPLQWGKKYRLKLKDGQIWIGKFENIDYDTRFILDIPTKKQGEPTDIKYGIDELAITKIEEV